MKKRIVRHIELVASIATMIVSIAAPNLLWRMGFDWTSRWLISVVIMALILGSMLSIVYHRRHVVRRKTIDQVREMLHDRIRNPLSVVWLYAQMLSNKESLHNIRIREAIKTIDAELENLSEDALHAWQINYESLNEELTSTRPPAEDAA